MNYGLGTIGDIATIPPGTGIEWDGYVTSGFFGFTQPVTAEVLAQIEGALYQQDWFSTVVLDPMPGNRVRVVATVRNGFAQLADARGAIEGAIYSFTADADGNPYNAGTDNIGVWRWPAGYNAPAGTTLIYQPPNTLPPSGGQCANPSLFCPCGQEFSVFDLGCVPTGKGKTIKQAFGLDGGTIAAGAVILTLVGVIALGKIVK